MHRPMNGTERFLYRLLRAVLIGLGGVVVVAFTAGALGMPKPAAMGYTFYLSILMGLVGLFIPVRDPKAREQTE
ncbi:hypothetical protein [Thiohalorhabdus sp.]|uniref:hypothetical protein n=1 Tax=Thiohalorhabdus sp. TaxID=3094134 RepID=UPI002FC34397